MAKTRAKPAATGRRPTPAAIKAVEVCVGVLRDTQTGKLAIRREHVDALSDEQLGYVQEMTEVLRRRLDDLARLVGVA